MTKKLMSSTLTMIMAFTVAPVAFADTVSVVTDNTASVTNELMVSARTGDNVSSGGRAGAGGRGGDAVATDDAGRASAGDGGNGGRGGDGGSIVSGDAIATGNLTTEVNTTEVEIIDNGTDDNQYNEYIDEYARASAVMAASSYRERASESALAIADSAEEESESASAEQAQSASGARDTVASENELSTEEDMYYDNTRSSVAASTQDGGDTTSTRTSNVDTEGGEESNYDETSSDFAESVQRQSESSSQEQSASASASRNETYDESQSAVAIDAAEQAAATDDIYHFQYQRVYVGTSDDQVMVAHAGDAAVASGGTVMAETGGNRTNGGAGHDGENGGDATTELDENGRAIGGDGGHGANGGTGGTIRTGLSDAFGTLTTTQNRTMTRIVRN